MQQAFQVADRIVVIRSTTLDVCETEEEVIEEVGITVAHEIAHHFGLDDERLHALGYA
jgi:predicted Zn-dependent protease with MMP-like domain